MNLLDVRTVIFGQLVVEVLGVLVTASLWYQNRRHFAGISFWVLDFAFQAAAAALIILRGSVPDWMTTVLANSLIIAGAISGYMGLERFVGKTSSQVHNYLLLIAFALVHSYFFFVQPSLAFRNLNVSIGLLIVCFQCAWLMLRRVQPGMRPLTQGVGLVFAGFCLASIIRIVVTVASPESNNDFFRSGTFDTLDLFSYQILLILLAYSLTLMVNGRLIAALQGQEEKFSKAFHSSPYAITLTRLADGRLLEVNAGFVDIFGHASAQVIGKTTSDLHIWTRAEDREAFIGALLKGQKVRGMEFQFRTKSGGSITGLCSADIIMLNNEQWILSSVNDITGRKHTEQALHRQNEYLTALQETMLELISQLDLNTLLENVVNRAAQLTGTSSGFLDLVDPATGQLEPRIGFGALAESLKIPTKPGEGLAGTVWKTGKPLVVDNYDEWPGRVAEFSRRSLHTVVGVPLRSGSRVLGVLGLAYAFDSKQAFGQETIELLTQFAQLASIAIENAQLYSTAQRELAERKQAEENLRHRNYELALLNEASQTLNSTLDLDEILARVLEELYEQLQVAGTFWLVDPETNEVVCRQASGPFGRVVQDWRLGPGEDIAGWVVQHGETLEVQDAALDPRHYEGIDRQTGQVYHSILCVPLRTKDRVIGALQVLDTQAGRFTEADKSLVEALGATAAIAIDNAGLYQDLQHELALRMRTEEELRALSLTDELTGLYNRRGFLVLAEQEIKLARRMKREVTVIYADLDGLKRINDTFGHAEGDQSLTNIVRVLKQTFRDSDIVARFGGDEFAVFAADSSGDSVETFLTRLRRNLDEENRLYRRPYNLSLSVGMASFPPGSTLSLDEMLAQADKAMYDERRGRNVGNPSPA